MRREKLVTIETDGRDKGKVFKITEAPAGQVEEWGARAFLAMMRSGIEVPDDILASGFAGLLRLGLHSLSGLSWAEAKPLLDEMMQTVQYLPDPSNPLTGRVPLESDIEEVMTRLQLRKEIFLLHQGFFKAAAPSTLAAA